MRSLSDYQVIVGAAAIAVSVVLVVKGLVRRKKDRDMYDKVMRQLHEDFKKDGSET